MMQPAQGTPWSAAAVRDTIAAIARGEEYQRALTDSIWSRITRWIAERIADLVSSISGTPNGRLITIGLLVAVVVLVALRLAIGISAERSARRVPRGARASGAGAPLLADAERLASAGDYTGAAHALFAALLAACAARGDVRLHASKTTGDYARELRRRNAPLLPPFQAFRGRYDRVIYGDLQCSADDYRALAQQARQLIDRERAA